MVQLRLPGYEGPLELLLELLEKQELDISEFSLVQVADQYLEHLRQIEAHAHDHLPDALAEFILIGSKLILLKSRAMLPREPDPFDEDAEDVGQELVDMLEEYRRFRDAAGVLGRIDQSGLRSFGPSAPRTVEAPAPKGLPDDVTLAALTRLVREALARASERERLHPEVQLEREPVTVSQKIRDLRGRLRSGRRVSFRDWIAEARTRVEVIVTFMAILELYKSRVIEMSQDKSYGDILVEARPGVALDEEAALDDEPAEEAGEPEPQPAAPPSVVSAD